MPLLYWDSAPGANAALQVRNHAGAPASRIYGSGIRAPGTNAALQVCRQAGAATQR